jgi:S-DNA-T family DNA segregation ATPase FtsK/SpoIIIE
MPAAKRPSGGAVVARPFETTAHSDEFDRLVREQRTSLERFTRRLGASAEDAEEIAATALLRAYQSGETHREAHVWRGWLRAVARNLWIDSVRRRRIHLVDIDHAPSDLAASAPAVHQLAEEAENARAICAAIALLPPAQRAVLYLREIRGLSYQEIATTLQLSESAVTSTLHRARAAIDRTERSRYAKLAAAFGVPWLVARAGAGKIGRVVASTAPAAGAAKVAIPVALLALTGATLTPRVLGGHHAPAPATATAGTAASLGSSLAPTVGFAAAPGRPASASPRRPADALAARFGMSLPSMRSHVSARPQSSAAVPQGPGDSAPSPAATPPAVAPPASLPAVTPSATSPGASSPVAPAVGTTPPSSHPAPAHPVKPPQSGAVGQGSAQSAAHASSQASAAKSAAAERRSLHQTTTLPGQSHATTTPAQSHATTTPAAAAGAVPSGTGKPVSNPGQAASAQAEARGPTTQTSTGVSATPAAPANAATPSGPPAQTPAVVPATPGPPQQSAAPAADADAGTPAAAAPADPNGQAPPGLGHSASQP